ncbi:hypothetical protein [Streptomyces sp. DSM 40750]|uniref:hypothetical protein n=1 Tax=Streptomyces sp. DSM 40750 TaxID=2801030 RepID=UPI00214CEA4E|nr:hypothetical protein [Streptomyces sp. DSM 40750]UUU22755.1 hypothetical protein JIX55_22030 [Streptomyces sp. DSM 40750]
MERLRRAFLDYDRRHGGAEPPPKAQVFVARHPVGAGLVCGVVTGLPLALALSAFRDPVLLLQTALIGLGAGLFVWLFCRFERRRQAHYARNGGFRWDPPRLPVQHEALPVWFEGMLWLSYWTVYMVVFWLVGQLRTPPFTWLQSAIYAGFLIIGSWAVQLSKERRRRRRR